MDKNILKSKDSMVLHVCDPDMAEAITLLGSETFLEAYESYFSDSDLKQYCHSVFEKQNIQKELVSDKILYKILHINKTVGGYIKLRWDRNCPEGVIAPAIELERIYLRKSFYRKNAGTFMMNEIKNYARLHAFASIFLGVWQENTRAIQFYKANGFTICGEKKFYLGELVNNDFIMTCNI